MKYSNLANMFINKGFSGFLTVRLSQNLSPEQAKELIRKKIIIPLQKRLNTSVAFIGVVVKQQPMESPPLLAHAHISLLTKAGHSAEQMLAVLNLPQEKTKPTRRPKAKDCPFCQTPGFVITCTTCGTTEPRKSPAPKSNKEIDLIPFTSAHPGYYDKPRNAGEIIWYGGHLIKGRLPNARGKEGNHADKEPTAHHDGF